MSRLALVFTGGNGTFTPNAYMGPPIGLVYLGTWVRRHTDWEVEIIDGRFCEVDMELMKRNHDVVGITAMTFQYESACRLARFLQFAKKVNPSCVGKIVIGGCHITLSPESMRPVFDCAIRGEGEYGLVDYLLTGRTKPHYPAVDLANYPDLDLDLLPKECWELRVVRAWHGRVVEAMLITSRGCPWRCKFCCTSEFWREGGFRLHSEEWVVRQAQRMAERGANVIQILDDLFTTKKNRLRRIVELWEREGLHKQIKGVGVQTRAELIDDEVCDLLRRINTKMVGFGFESWDDRVLRHLKGGKSSVATNKAAVKTVHAAGLQSMGALMMGNPTETFWEMLRTVRGILWMWWHGAGDIWLYVARPFPRTDFWDTAKANGRTAKIEANWDNLRLRTRMPGDAEMLSIPRWQFLIAWWLGQLALIPFKVPKVWTMTRDAIKGLFGKPDRTEADRVARARIGMVLMQELNEKFKRKGG